VTEGQRVHRSALPAERTHRAVLDAAGRRFQERGYAGTTMRGVAAAAGSPCPPSSRRGPRRRCCSELLQRLLTSTDLGEELQSLREISLRHVLSNEAAMRLLAHAAAVEPELAAAWTEYGRRRYADLRTRSAATVVALSCRPGLLPQLPAAPVHRPGAGG
jgi:hypothetical protein